jgi:hypothetical protein
VFASSAHEDDQVVRAFAEAYRALGIEVLVDRASRRAGQDWQPTLLGLIGEADLFQLFWSEAASRSPYVAEEWRHARSLQGRKGERFIRRCTGPAHGRRRRRSSRTCTSPPSTSPPCPASQAGSSLRPWTSS